MEVQGENKNSINDTMFSPLKKKRYSDQIADLIQDKILGDHIEIGTNLPSEKALALEFQVSRSVIREALRILEISGLVNIKKGPSGGIFVTDGYYKPIKKSLGNMITSGEVTVDHLFDVRMLIEPHIAMEAALHATDEDIKKLRDLITDSTRHPDDPARLKKNNLNFHLLLARASGNPILSILLESVFQLLIEISLDFLDLKLEKHFYKVHKRIFQVIEQKRPEEAKRLIQEDIKDLMETLKGFKRTRRP